MKLPGASVLLTGATGGIGEAVALALHAEGTRLVLSGRRTDRLAEIAERTRARTIACDLADRAAVARLAEEAGRVDVLVANAGVPAGGSVDGHSLSDLDTALDVNLRAPMVLARLLSEQMVARGGGHIVFMSSLAGRAASPGGAVYSATKFGLRGFALGLREDLHGYGVGVSTVLPGFISEAGMFAYSEATLPRIVGTRRPRDVARAVIDAIENDRPEIDVAPLALRVGARIGGVAPGLASLFQRRFGAAEMAAAISEGQARAHAAQREAFSPGRQDASPAAVLEEPRA